MFSCQCQQVVRRFRNAGRKASYCVFHNHNNVARFRTSISAQTNLPVPPLVPVDGGKHQRVRSSLKLKVNISHHQRRGASEQRCSAQVVFRHYHRIIIIITIMNEQLIYKSLIIIIIFGNRVGSKKQSESRLPQQKVPPGQNSPNSAEWMSLSACL